MSNLHDHLTRWGAAQQRPPTNNDALKTQVLDRARPRVAERPVERAWRMPWMSLALAGAAVVAIAIAPRTPPLTPPPEEGENQMRSTAMAPYATQNAQRPSDSNGAADFPADTLAPAGEVGLAAPEASAVWNFLSQESSRKSRTSPPAPSIAPYPYPYPMPPREVPIVDDREYLKTDYAAMLRTRRVLTDGERIATTVRGHGGRMDRMTLTEQYGSLAFALPEDELDAFRTELHTMIRAPFITETFVTENLLPQQRGLEDSAERITETRNARVQELADRTAEHDRTIAAFRTQLHTARQQLDAARAEEPTTTAGIIAKQQRIATLENNARLMERRIANENTAFEKQRAQLEAAVAAQDRALTDNSEHQGELLDTVRTVRGTVSLHHLTLASMAGTYLHMHWIAAILLGLACIAFARWYHRTATPLVP